MERRMPISVWDREKTSSYNDIWLRDPKGKWKRWVREGDVSKDIPSRRNNMCTHPVREHGTLLPKVIQYVYSMSWETRKGRGLKGAFIWHVFFQIYWDILGIQYCVRLKCTIWWFNTWVYCEMFVKVRLCNECILHLIKLQFCCCYGECWKSTPIATFMYITQYGWLFALDSQDLVILEQKVYTPLHLPSSPSLWHSQCYFWKFNIFRCHIQVISYSIFLSLSNVFHLA